MTPEHVIRLRGPWEWELIAALSSPPADNSGRVQVPCDWSVVLGTQFLGRVRFTRRFNQPLRVDPREQVWLVIAADTATCDVWLNDVPLTGERGELTQWRYDIGHYWTSRNELRVELGRESEAGSPVRWLDDVWLEFHN